MTERVDAVVIGSGFGGAVCAARLAQGGQDVLVLERGRPYPPGSFPRTPDELRHALWDPRADLHGLYDVWRFHRLDAVVSSGLGGGSLIYANVLLRPPREWLADWPVTYDDLEPHYEQVEQMLGATPYPWADTTPKTARYRAAADARGLPWRAVNLAVSFGDRPGDPIPEPPDGNLHGLPRTTCTKLGECDVGCNVGAKNTLDYTYLQAAHDAGATIRTLCEVRTLAPLDGDGSAGWRVGYTAHLSARDGHRTDPPDGEPERVVEADRVIVAAGTFGTQLLLQRNANALPRVSPRLGEGVSANGDLLTFAMGCDTPLRPSVGPVITTAIEQVDAEGGFFLEDAGFPAIGEWLWHAVGAAPGLWAERKLILDLVASSFRKRADANVSAELSRLFGEGATSVRMMPLLGMGRDAGDGRLGLDGEGRLTCAWSIDESRTFFDGLLATARAVAEEMGGALWDTAVGELDRIVTVHPLGGCGMGADSALGVVDGHGRVHGARNLYVADGSAMPEPIGANPSLTIAAFAERVAAGIGAST
jgi:cholesterol oxidase